MVCLVLEFLEFSDYSELRQSHKQLYSAILQNRGILSFFGAGPSLNVLKTTTKVGHWGRGVPYIHIHVYMYIYIYMLISPPRIYLEGSTWPGLCRHRSIRHLAPTLVFVLSSVMLLLFLHC